MVIKDSRVVAEEGQTSRPLTGLHNNLPESIGIVNLAPYSEETFKIPAESETINVIGVREGDLFTDALVMEATVVDGFAVADPDKDLAKVFVFDRHEGRSAAKAFAAGFGIRKGAIATTSGHDAHNLCVLGVNDRDMYLAVKKAEELNGGIVAVAGGKIEAELPLPIAGLMSNKELDTVVEELADMKRAIRRMGSKTDILMVLHFIQLAVIPKLKVTDLGLVDLGKQEFVPLFR